MARLNVYPMPRGGRGWLLDVQADVLERLSTRTVLPLVPMSESQPPLKVLNPVFPVAGEEAVMVTQAIATVPRTELRQPVASLDREHDRIARALDLLLTGF